MSGRKGPMNYNVIDRIEDKIHDLTRTLTQLEGVLSRHEEGSWEYDQAQHEICKIEQKIRKEERKLSYMDF